MKYISKGRIDTLSDCRRKYYYQYCHGGYGMEVPGVNPNLITGILTHKGMEHMLREVSIKAGVEAIREYDIPDTGGGIIEEQVMEGAVLAEAFIRAWGKLFLNDFLAKNTIIGIEMEADLLIAPGLTLFTKTDLVREERATSMVIVDNWKTSQDIRDWPGRWRYDIQTFSEAVAVEAKLGRAVAGTVMHGFYKGQRRDGQLTSPLIYGWKKGIALSPTYKAGHVKVPVWKELAIEEWVGVQDREVLESQFISTPPMPKTDSVVEGWLNEVVREESDASHILEGGTEEDKMLFFRRNIGKRCRYCPFEPVCFERTTIDDLEKAGLLKRRESPLNERNDAAKDALEAGATA